jgi:hypothetical protein
MPHIVGVGDTVTSSTQMVDGQRLQLRGGSDRGFLTLVQALGETFGAGSTVIYIDSSGGEVRRPGLDATHLQLHAADPALEPWPALEGITDPADPLRLDVVFCGGHAQYVPFFCALAERRVPRCSCSASVGLRGRRRCAGATFDLYDSVDDAQRDLRQAAFLASNAAAVAPVEHPLVDRTGEVAAVELATVERHILMRAEAVEGLQFAAFRPQQDDFTPVNIVGRCIAFHQAAQLAHRGVGHGSISVGFETGRREFALDLTRRAILGPVP